jgi:hypothetical protein
MNIKTLAYIPSSELFKKMSDLSDGSLLTEDVARIFSENCNDVSYGDNNFTLITVERFLNKIREIPEFDNEDIILPLKELLQLKGILVDLES